MNKRIFGIIFLISFSVLFSSQDAFAVLPFLDDFSKDPMDNGWTVEIIGGAGSDNISLLFPLHVNPDNHGTEVILDKDSSGATARFFSIKQIISTECFENIKISLTAHQSPAGAYEPADFLEIRVDTIGNGIFELVQRDVEIWEGVNDPDVTQLDTNGNANGSPTSTGFIPLPNAATNNPNLNIKIVAKFNSNTEDYFLTEVEVIGDAIQGICDAVGGNILEIDNYALFVAAIGTNPVITGLVGITLAGIAGQTLWFVHRRKNS